MPQSVCKESIYHGVFQQHATALRNYLYYQCGNMKQAEDIVQDCFIKLWQNCAKVSVEKAKSYLYTLGKNQFLNEVSHQKVVLKFVNNQRPQDDYETPQFQLEQQEFKLRLEQAISALPEGQRIVFLMNRIDKKKYREISEELGISVKAVEKRMHQALLKLRKIHKKI